MGNIDKGSFYQQKYCDALRHTGYVFDQSIFFVVGSIYRTPFQLSFSYYLKSSTVLNWHHVLFCPQILGIKSNMTPLQILFLSKSNILIWSSFKYNMKKASIFPTVMGLPFLNIPKKYTDSIRNGPHSVLCTLVCSKQQKCKLNKVFCHKKIRPKISFSSLLDTTTTIYVSTTFWQLCPFWCWLQGLFALFFWSCLFPP